MVRIVQCVFWLMIVYAAILTHGSFRLSDLKWDAGDAVARQENGHAATAGTRAVDVVGTLAAGTTFCARHVDECLADAKRLTALFAETEPRMRTAAIDADPLPVREPRHKRRDANPARTP